MEPPPGTYVRFALRSRLAFTNKVRVIGGVISPDYRDNIKIGLNNQSITRYVVNKSHRVA